jgi:hypothetical protein
MRLRKAQFRSTKTLEQFDFERLPQLNRALVHDLATGRYVRECSPVLIVGPSGTGKSHLAQALGHCAVRQGTDVLFTSCLALTQALHTARATNAYERKLQELSRIPVLIIDDCLDKQHSFALDVDGRARHASEYALALLRDIGMGAYPSMADHGRLIPDFFLSQSSSIFKRPISP